MGRASRRAHQAGIRRRRGRPVRVGDRPQLARSDVVRRLARVQRRWRARSCRVPARPSRAITSISGSSSSSRAKRCSLLRGRKPQGSGAPCGSRTNSPFTARTSADWDPERSTANSFSVIATGTSSPAWPVARTASMAIATSGVQAVDRIVRGVEGCPANCRAGRRRVGIECVRLP